MENKDSKKVANDFNVISECRYGKMIYNKNDIYIGKSLAYYGEYSEGEVDVFRQILREGHYVVEAGANIGAHTVAMAQIIGDYGKLFAFEPQRRVFQTLNGNVAINSLRNVFCFQKALAKERGSILVPILNTEVPNNFGALALGSWEYGEEVDVVTIDSLDLPACRLIKVDVEGMELDVLKGAENTISKYKPVLYVEIDQEDKKQSLLEYVDSLGYYMYLHEPSLFNTNNFKGKKENIFINDAGLVVISKNMICIPKEPIGGNFNMTGFLKIAAK